MQVVCNQCENRYEEEDLILLEDEEGYFYGCPVCKTDHYLMDKYDTEK